MIHISNIFLAMILLSVLLSLRSNRLMALVKLMAFQGIVVSAVPMVLDTAHGLTFNLIMFFILLVLVKGILIPGMMSVAVNKVVASREIEPIIGYHASLFAGLIMIVFSVYITNQLNLASLAASHKLLLVTGITTMGAGLILLMARRKAITQVIGYLMMENGIYLIGTALAKEVHTQYVVEFAVLLDLLVAVLVMGIVLNDINHTFDDVDTALLGQLKD
ncbi:MAG: hydrogenase [Proteobacteria bacterium]|nr:hydrogenase [Pseudomonadota bacterium]MBU1058131.1 hydrogenase [Pseudomonadota bacterium]